MPVVQKVGPDGCLYVLDWYDRYHCYQDASADPEGVDRGHGRLYRVVHEATGRPEPVALDKATGPELVKRLGDANIYVRETAQRLLAEKKCAGAVAQLEALVLDDQVNHKHRMHALWALVSGQALSKQTAAKLLASKYNSIRSWGVRTVVSLHSADTQLAHRVVLLAKDGSRDVQLQVAIATAKLTGIDKLRVWVDVLASCGDDPLIPHIVWQNLHPQLPADSDKLLAMVEGIDIEKAHGLAALLPKVAEKLQDSQ